MDNHATPEPEPQYQPNHEPKHEPTAAAPASTGHWERAVLEKLVLSTLTEQRTARRWRNGLRLAWLLVFLVLIWFGFHKADPSMDISGPHTAVVGIKGEIASGSEASAEGILSALRSAFEADEAKAIVLQIDSPGGSPVQAGLIYDEIMRLKKKHDKPIYAVCEEECASAAYYIAAATDQIYADKASIVGSIGVLMDGFGFTGLMDKLGVQRRLMTAGTNKGMLDPFSPESEAQKAYAQAMLNQIHQQFIKAVKTGRGDRLKEAPDLFSGLFWNGEQAAALGLIDGLGSVDSVARDIVKVDNLVDYTQRENVAERLAKRFGAAMGHAAVGALTSSPSLH